jgi:leader peptidase (prepilin peptidase)/N-methyltransferase
MNSLFNVFIVAFGAVIGSFLNVCIYRIPAGKSLVSPGSACPGCGHSIRFYDNLPVLSYLWLRGRCRDCGQRISPRYIAVEMLTAVIALLLFMQYGLTLPFGAAFIFASVLIVVTFIDIDHGIIPDVITLPGIPIFLALSVLVMKNSFWDAVLGMVLGGGLFYLIAVGYEFFAEREGMGGGDIKLLAMLGAFLGWQSLVFILLVSSLLGSVVGVGVMMVKKADMKYAVPFGPFLAVAAVAYIFWGCEFGYLMMLYFG